MQLSPRGTLPNKVATLPVQWKPDADHYDAQESFRRKFPRLIKNTAWSSRNNLAGRDPLSIPVAELCWQGCENGSLRWLACGDFVSVIMARSMSEVVLMERLLKLIRTNFVDLNQVGAKAFQEQRPSDKPDPLTNQGKSELMQCLAQHLFENLPTGTDELRDMRAQVLTLQKQLAESQHKAQSLGKPGGKPRARPSPEEPEADDSLEEVPSPVNPSAVVADDKVKEPPAKRAKRATTKPKVPLHNKDIRAFTSAGVPLPARSQTAEDASDTQPGDAEGSHELSAVDLSVFDPQCRPVDRPLANSAPKTATPQGVTKWVTGLKLPPPLKAKFQQLTSSVKGILACLGPEKIAYLSDRAAELGLPVQLASQMANPELLKVIYAASMMEV